MGDGGLEEGGGDNVGGDKSGEGLRGAGGGNETSIGGLQEGDGPGGGEYVSGALTRVAFTVRVAEESAKSLYTARKAASMSCANAGTFFSDTS